jgi:cation transport ATPase
VNLAATSAEVEIDPGVDTASLIAAVEKIGYRIAPAAEQPRDVAAQYGEGERTQWRLFWLSAVLSLPVMVLAMFVPQSTWNYWLQFLLVTPVVFIPGWQYHRMAWRLARTFSANMDTLISLGSLAAYVYSVIALGTLTGTSTSRPRV